MNEREGVTLRRYGAGSRKQEARAASCCQLLPAAGLPVAIDLPDKQRGMRNYSESQGV